MATNFGVAIPLTSLEHILYVSCAVFSVYHGSVWTSDL